MTREEWLNLALSELREHVFAANGVKWPEECKVKVSCGWPSSRALSKRHRTVGFCHPKEHSKGKFNEIFISPLTDNSIDVLGYEAHEIIHALDNCKSHHRGFFLKTAREIGLEGKPTSTHPGEKLTECLNSIIGRIGEYPHTEMDPAVKDRKQSTRLVKAECPGCGYVIRTTRKWIEEAGLPTCPCGQVFKQQEGGEKE